jgi:diguanylate cyclase (GGDEF)-like protein
MQHAFAGGVTTASSPMWKDVLSLTGAGDMIWDWDVSADKGLHQPEAEAPARAQTRRARWPRPGAGSTCCIRSTATASAPRSTALEQRRDAWSGFPPCARRATHLWFSIKARPVVGSDGGGAVGTLTDVTEFKNAEERLLHDAVHDNLTGLPNRELFLDRLEAVLALSKADPAIHPTVIVVDLDRFKQVNDSVGIAVGDSILLTLARRLGRLLKPQDTLARLSGDQFGLILLSEREADKIIGFAETLRKALRAPITFNDREIFLTASMGIALPDGQPHRTEEVLKDAELAMYRQRIGGDRMEVFKPSMRAPFDRLTLESGAPRSTRRSPFSTSDHAARPLGGFRALALGPSQAGAAVAG